MRAVAPNSDAVLALAVYASRKLPRHPEPWDTLGSVYLERGDAKAAVAAFEKSVALAPGNQAYRERLNEARRRAS